ncbi:MAG: glycosyltransferase [Lachnospiraceae bacterium]|nr:glycosyltransferase [Lachnospiraceae bacterium]
MKKERKRLLFISTRAFWRMDGGHQYEIYHYLRGLSEQYHYEIYIYTFVEDEKSDNQSGIPVYVNEVQFAWPITKIDILKNIIVHLFDFSNPWPLQATLFYSKKNSRALKIYIDRIQPDVIYVDMVRLATYIHVFDDSQYVKVLGYDDLLSERYKRQIDTGSSSSNVAGAYTDRLPSVISKLQKLKILKNLVLSFEAKRIARSEIYYAGKYDSSIFVSAIETKKFNDKLGREMAYTVSMGIDYAYQSEKLDVESIPNSVSYVGNMKTAANYETVIFIIDEVLPNIQSECIFYVIGACPEDLKQKYKELKNIIFTGRVDDLRTSIKATTVFLSPIAFGTGIKTKILEAFAMGMPVVTNSIGIEGIEADHGIHCCIADRPIEIARYVDELLMNQAYREGLGYNAQRLAREKYQWEENWKGFAKAGF